MHSHLHRLAISVLLAYGLASCAGSTGASGGASPENPLDIRYTGAANADVVKMVVKVVSDRGIRMRQADEQRGIVETAWFDVGQYENLGFAAGGYPAKERNVFFLFEIGSAADNTSRLEIGGYYRPFDPTRDVPVPNDHPAARLARIFEESIRQEMIRASVTLVSEEEMSDR